MQLLLPHCCKTSWIVMLRVLPPAFEPALQPFFYVWWNAQQPYSTGFAAMLHVARFFCCCPFYRTFKTVNRLLCEGSGRAQLALSVFFCLSIPKNIASVWDIWWSYTRWCLRGIGELDLAYGQPLRRRGGGGGGKRTSYPLLRPRRGSSRAKVNVTV